ncbi:MAG: tRNA pseudouridine(55) synthase TruB [Ruminococcus sp.]|nr:tRNA pseudouridine(55) synthase TruB [Ruminococcus sp.]
MNGIICIDKPQGFTSFDVVAKLRGILKLRRLGHAGTLDPMATGVLPVFVGTATKACDILPCQEKSYLAHFRLGAVSDTQDSTGTILSESDLPVSREQLESVLPRFVGEIEQIPPMYSAVSVGGKRLYELARQGIEIERKPRTLTIEALELRSYDASARTGTLYIACSKGTYVRTIIHDIGAALSCGGLMTALRRESSSGFTLSDCVTFEMLEAARDAGTLESYMIPIERAFESLPKLTLSAAQTKMYKNGVKLSLDKLHGLCGAEVYAVCGADGFLGTAVPDPAQNCLRVGKNLT